MRPSALTVRGEAYANRLEALVTDVGRLRRRLAEDSYDAFLAERIGEHVEILDRLLQPTAAELYQAHGSIGGALTDVDRYARWLRSLMGYGEERR